MSGSLEKLGCDGEKGRKMKGFCLVIQFLFGFLFLISSGRLVQN